MEQIPHTAQGDRMPESRRKTFGRMLGVNRRSLGYTQEQLAKLLGFEGAGAISAIERGENAPSFDKLLAILDFFQTSLEAMTTGRCKRSHGGNTYIDTSFSASDGSTIVVGAKDLKELGEMGALFVRLRKHDPPAPESTPVESDGTQ